MKKLIQGTVLLLLFSLNHTFPSIAFAENKTNHLPLYTSLTLAGLGAIGAIVASLIHGGGEHLTPDEFVTAGNVSFNEPGAAGTQFLTLKNPRPNPVKIKDLQFTEGAYENVEVVSGGSCPDLPFEMAADSSCTIKLQADPKTYPGTAQVYYGQNHKIATSKIDTAKCSLKLYETTSENDVEIPTNKEILVEKILNPLPGPHPQTFKWVNQGLFYWTEPYMEWKTNFPKDVELKEESCGTFNNPGVSVPPNGSCSFALTVKEADLNDQGAISTLSKKNTLDLPAYDKNVVMKNGIAIIKNENPEDFHLNYRSVKILNTTTKDNITLNSIDIIIDQAEGKVKYCAPGDLDCYYQTEAKCQAGQQLSANESCKIWFKTQNNNDYKLYKKTNIKINITIDASGSNVSFRDKIIFDAIADQAIYAGGDFTAPFSHLAKWDGSNWHPLDNGLNNSIYELAIREDNGELYAGGNFTSPHNYISRWNGNNWNQVANNNINHNVLCFSYSHNDESLYIGGSFTNPGSKIAKCDVNDLCTALAGDPLTSGNIYNLLHYDHFIYMGGSFDTTMSNTKRILKYDTTTNNWHSLGELNQPVHALSPPMTSVNSDPISNSIFIGGEFSKSYQPDPYISVYNHALTLWNFNDQEWEKMPISPEFESHDAVHTLLTINSTTYPYLYAGGIFNTPHGNYITKYLHSDESWYSLKPSPNDNVYILTHLGPALIYAGGKFTNIGNRIALWNEDDNNWYQVGPTSGPDAINNTVRALAISTSLEIKFNQRVEYGS